MKYFIRYSLWILVILAITSCNDEFDLNADYKDITVVYGLLDQGINTNENNNNDTIFIRLNKAFLGEGDAMEMAQIPDSSNYKTDVAITLDEFNGTNFLNTFYFDTIITDQKEDGVFYNPYQLLYYSVVEIDQLHTYDLLIQIGDKQVQATTPVVNDFSITFPPAGLQKIIIRYDHPQTIEWESARNGKRYEILLRFNFRELFVDNPDTNDRYIDWYLGVKRSDNTDGNEEMIQIFGGSQFYAWIEDVVPYDDAEKEARIQARFTVTLDYIFRVGAEELNIYMDVNAPSNSIVQERPEYTNIENGIGIFSSRYEKVRDIQLHPETITNIKNLDTDLKFEY